MSAFTFRIRGNIRVEDLKRPTQRRSLSLSQGPSVVMFEGKWASTLLLMWLDQPRRDNACPPGLGVVSVPIAATRGIEFDLDLVHNSNLALLR
jgi:hypothetical protein